MFCNSTILKSKRLLRCDNKIQYLYYGTMKMLMYKNLTQQFHGWLRVQSIFIDLLIHKFYPGEYSNFRPSEQSIYQPRFNCLKLIKSLPWMRMCENLIFKFNPETWIRDKTTKNINTPPLFGLQRLARNHTSLAKLSSYLRASEGRRKLQLQRRQKNLESWDVIQLSAENQLDCAFFCNSKSNKEYLWDVVNFLLRVRWTMASATQTSPGVQQCQAQGLLFCPWLGSLELGQNWNV